ncbi:hypothetical protein FNV68_53930 [Streptomyces sp. S1D4-23]|nr:hypothetical protein FNV61_52870 [Streptomyces sp. RLB3-6]QDO13792.1 hypothetical protein FNV68_53930 [Streptomyces sp. S1D4-23]
MRSRHPTVLPQGPRPSRAGGPRDHNSTQALEQELEGSVRKARLLDQRAPAETVRVATDGRLVVDIAREVVAATGWAGPHFARRS